MDLWGNRTYKLKRATDHPMVIRISEFGKLLLVESGIQEFFPWNPESWALGFNDRILNLLPGIRNPQRGLQNPRLSCPVFLLY